MNILKGLPMPADVKDTLQETTLQSQATKQEIADCREEGSIQNTIAPSIFHPPSCIRLHLVFPTLGFLESGIAVFWNSTLKILSSW